MVRAGLSSGSDGMDHATALPSSSLASYDPAASVISARGTSLSFASLPKPKCHGVWGRLPKEETMRRFFLATVVAALISPLPVVAQQSLSAAQDERKQARGEDSKHPWTLLIYGAVDNDANDPFVEFLNQARRGLDNDPGIELLVFIDRSEKHRKRVPTYLGEDFTGTRLYRLTKDTAERLSGGSQLPEITLDKDVELNSADAKYL